jgi:hypothetical protein
LRASDENFEERISSQEKGRKKEAEEFCNKEVHNL